MYFDIFKKSWYTLKNHLILFVPDLIFAIFALIFGILFLKISGILNFLIKNVQLENSVVLLSFLRSNFLAITVSFLIFIVTTFFIGAALVSIKYSMMKDVVLKKKISLKGALKESKKYILQVIWLRILIFFIGVIVLFLLGFITKIILTGQKTFILIFVWTLFSLIAFGFIKILLLFRYPIMFFEKENALNVIRNSIFYFRKNIKHVFTVFLIIVGVGILFNFVVVPLNLLIESGRNFLDKFAGNFLKIVLITLSSFIKSLVSLIFIVWADMFLFFSYKLKR